MTAPMRIHAAVAERLRSRCISTGTSEKEKIGNKVSKGRLWTGIKLSATSVLKEGCQMVKVMVGVVLLLLAGVLYCCIVAGVRADRKMQDFNKRRKESAGKQDGSD